MLRSAQQHGGALAIEHMLDLFNRLIERAHDHRSPLGHLLSPGLQGQCHVIEPQQWRAGDIGDELLQDRA